MDKLRNKKIETREGTTWGGGIKELILMNTIKLWCQKHIRTRQKNGRTKCKGVREPNLEKNVRKNQNTRKR